MSISVSVEGISKVYRLGADRSAGYRTLRESISSTADSTVRWLGRALKGKVTDRDRFVDHRALSNLSFDIRAGEAVGIIGRNGAGKSTLLKILSRITSPTSGRVTTWGRLGSLLEVGTGFHPELTGRENIFLNGAILGMGRRELMRKYDAIVDFAEIKKFIDTPVKRYSSGMYVRLAFSVSAHMEPNILLIDEVLSVGDLAFQRKCLDHAKRLKERSTTLVFVSHNMFAVKSLCDRAILLSQGNVRYDGTTEEAARLYVEESDLGIPGWASEMVGDDPRKCSIHVTKLEVLDEDEQPRNMFTFGSRMRLRLHFEALADVEEPIFSIGIARSDGVACCNYNTMMDGLAIGTVRGEGAIEVVTPPLKLVADQYSLHIMIWNRGFHKLLSAQEGQTFHVAHSHLNSNFGVFHEAAEWRLN